MSKESSEEPPSPLPLSAFPTTQWSLIITANDADDSKVLVALEELCRIYWYPVYAFIRRRGFDGHEALDMTQDFFVEFLETNFVKRADPERGRFRGFLFCCLRNFLGRTGEYRRAQIRGGGTVIVSLSAETASERFKLEPVEDGLSPEEAYDRSWALSIIERALSDLEIEYRSSGRGLLFDRLRQNVWGDDAETHEQIAAELGVTANAVKTYAHRLRKRLRDRLREAVAQTVANSDDTEDELGVLLSALQPNRKRHV